MKVKLLTTVFLVLLPGCAVNVSIVDHDEAKAEERGRAFLEELYLRKNYRGALSHFDSDTRTRMTEASLKQTVTPILGELGPVTAVQYHRFEPVLGKRSAVVKFVVIHRAGRSYQRVSLRGDAGGYFVEHISHSSQPFNE